MRAIENLVFKGGGILGAAYIGAFDELQKRRLAGNTDPNETSAQGGSPERIIVYGNVKRVSGTSAGSVFALLVALGNSAEAIKKIITSKEQVEFADATSLAWEDGGLCKGENLKTWLEERVAYALGNGKATFADLHAQATANSRFKDLYVFAKSVQSNNIVEFSYQTTPDVPLAHAVRASGSVPFFYVPFRFEGDLAQRYPGTFIDGGVGYNYAISNFDDGEANKRTLGFFLQNMSFDHESELRVLVHLSLHYMFKKTFNDKKGFDDFMLVAESVLDLYQSFDNPPTAEQWATFMAVPVHAQATNLPPYPTTADEAQEGLMLCLAVIKRLNDESKSQDNDICPLAYLVITLNIVLLLIYLKKHEADLQEFIERLIELVEDIPEEIKMLLHKLSWLSSILSAMFSIPSNIVFERDAQRTVFVNCLGYQFVDFWMPQCNMQKLIDSGATCTRDYLNLMLYT